MLIFGRRCSTTHVSFCFVMEGQYTHVPLDGTPLTATYKAQVDKAIEF